MKPAAETPAPPAAQTVGTAPIAPAFAGIWTLVWKSRGSRRHWPKILGLHLGLPAIILLTGGPDRIGSYLQVILKLQLMLAMPLVCLVNMAAPIRDEAAEGTLCFLSVRPIRRGVFFLLLHAAHLLWLEIHFLFSGLLLLGVGFWLEVPGLSHLVVPLLLAQAAGVFAFSGLSAFLGLLTRRYLILGLLYGAIVEVGIGGIPTNINALSLGHHVRVIVSAFQPAGDLLRANQGQVGLSLLVLLLVGLITAGAASLLYSAREVPPGPEA
ncbi:MAG: hypothetical protein R3F07_20500 [Opitutaceae bacterium]